MATIMADTIFYGQTDVDRAVRHALMAMMDENVSDLPGSDPAPFLQPPHDIGDIEFHANHSCQRLVQVIRQGSFWYPGATTSVPN